MLSKDRQRKMQRDDKCNPIYSFSIKFTQGHTQSIIKRTSWNIGCFDACEIIHNIPKIVTTIIINILFVITWIIYCKRISTYLLTYSRTCTITHFIILCTCFAVYLARTLDASNRTIFWTTPYFYAKIILRINIR